MYLLIVITVMKAGVQHAAGAHDNAMFSIKMEGMDRQASIWYMQIWGIEGPSIRSGTAEGPLLLCERFVQVDIQREYKSPCEVHDMNLICSIGCCGGQIKPQFLAQELIWFRELRLLLLILLDLY
jgi:hypothetical protein